MKMRSKLLKMQEEAVKYKQIQAKLAAGNVVLHLTLHCFFPNV